MTREQKLIYNKEYYAKNREKLLAQKKSYWYTYTEAQRARKKEWMKTYGQCHKEEQRLRSTKHRAKKKYGLSLKEYMQMLAQPCGICGAPSTHLDHCHATNIVRGALCRRCNLLIGYANDSHLLLTSAIKYLLVKKECHNG